MVLLGRMERNDVVLREGSVSSRHAAVLVTSEERVFVVDLNSTNGTFVLESGLPRQASFTEISLEATIQLGTVQISVERILERKAPRDTGEYTTVLDLDSGQLVRRRRL